MKSYRIFTNCTSCFCQTNILGICWCYCLFTIFDWNANRWKEFCWSSLEIQTNPRHFIQLTNKCQSTDIGWNTDGSRLIATVTNLSKVSVFSVSTSGCLSAASNTCIYNCREVLWSDCSSLTIEGSLLAPLINSSRESLPTDKRERLSVMANCFFPKTNLHPEKSS